MFLFMFIQHRKDVNHVNGKVKGTRLGITHAQICMLHKEIKSTHCSLKQTSKQRSQLQGASSASPCRKGSTMQWHLTVILFRDPDYGFDTTIKRYLYVRVLWSVNSHGCCALININIGLLSARVDLTR